MARIVCGFCAVAADAGKPCVNCRHDPVLPYTQRGQEPVPFDGRVRLAQARRALGHDASVARIAEFLDVSERTVERWRADVASAS